MKEFEEAQLHKKAAEKGPADTDRIVKRLSPAVQAGRCLSCI